MGYLNLFVKTITIDVEGVPTEVRAYLDAPYDDNGTDDGYKWSDSATETGYQKVGTIADFLAINGLDLGKADFIAKKDALKQVVIAAGGGNEDAGIDTIADNTVQRYVCSYLIGSYSKRVTVFGGDFVAMENATRPYHPLATICRKERLDKAVVNGHSVIPQYMLTVLTDVGPMIDWYKEQGIKGQPYDPIEYGYGLSNYVNGLAPFDGIATVPWLGTTCLGLKDKGWTGNNGQAVADIALLWDDILFEHGI